MIYEPPLLEISDAATNVSGLDDLLARANFPEIDASLTLDILESCAAFVRKKIAPAAARLDVEGCHFEGGRVRLPSGFAEIWQGYTEGGWLGLSLPREQGGHGLPKLIQAAFSEMVCGSCVAASMMPLLVRGAATLVADHAADPVKIEFLPKLISGTWAATICITEAEAGSDVGAIKTAAHYNGDGRWTLNGTKIFISFGDHPLTEGILHIVLARTDNGENGSAGLGLFAVPAYNDSRRDASVVPLRIEHKLGLNASPTCVMQFDDAVGFPLGPPNAGLKTIFAMINLMRLEVAVQGVGLSAAAVQAATAYAELRLQGSRGNVKTPIAQHPDVRRNLFTMRALSEGSRVLSYEAAKLLDLAQYARDASERQRAAHLAAFLLPICKAGCSETAVAVTDLAIQVHGGHGYIRDSGIERLYRDARILPIYEGTTGIQAIDLVFRKLSAGGGFVEFLSQVRLDLESAFAAEAPRELTEGMRDAIRICEACADRLRSQAANDRDAALAGATPFLNLVYKLSLGWAWLRLVTHSRRDQTDLYLCAAFYGEQILPEVSFLQQRILGNSSAWLRAIERPGYRAAAGAA